MYKLMMLIKKRPDLSMAQFMDYYDNHHIHFMHGLFAKGAAVHRRNFIVGRDASMPDPDCDVVVEVFYEDLATAQAVAKQLEDPELRRRMQEDEDRFILRGSVRRFVVEAHETVFRPLPKS